MAALFSTATVAQVFKKNILKGTDKTDYSLVSADISNKLAILSQHIVCLYSSKFK